MYTKLGLFIGGKWIYEAEKGENVLNPADESILGWLPHATKVDLDEAVKSSELGFNEWSNTNPDKRSSIILKAADILSQRVSEISRVMTLEQGKPLAESVGEINQSIAMLKFNGTNAKLIKDELVAPCLVNKLMKLQNITAINTPEKYIIRVITEYEIVTTSTMRY